MFQILLKNSDFSNKSFFPPFSAVLEIGVNDNWNFTVLKSKFKINYFNTDHLYIQAKYQQSLQSHSLSKMKKKISKYIYPSTV